jgi:hypothetical protein
LLCRNEGASKKKHRPRLPSLLLQLRRRRGASFPLLAPRRAPLTAARVSWSFSAVESRALSSLPPSPSSLQTREGCRRKPNPPPHDDREPASSFVVVVVTAALPMPRGHRCVRQAQALNPNYSRSLPAENRRLTGVARCFQALLIPPTPLFSRLVRDRDMRKRWIIRTASFSNCFFPKGRRGHLRYCYRAPRRFEIRNGFCAASVENLEKTGARSGPGASAAASTPQHSTIGLGMKIPRHGWG